MWPTDTKWQIQFLPCGVSFLVPHKKGERGAQKVNLPCQYCPWLLGFEFFWSVLLERAPDLRKNTGDNKSLENVYFTAHLLYKCCKRWFLLHMDKMLNTSSYLFTNTNLRISYSPSYLPSSGCLKSWAGLKRGLHNCSEQVSCPVLPTWEIL